MIAYVITQPWVDEVLLTDGSWGHVHMYWERAEIFTCLVRANRRAKSVKGQACQWEIDEPQPSIEGDWVDSPEPPDSLLSSAQPSLSVPRSHGLF